MELVSVIVPVYNVEKYIRRCVDSIIGQSYKNLEIILVDDGSTDNSGKICDEYAKKDNRIKVIHKKNGGLSSARNVGIKKSNGNFLSFIDSDDYIDDNMIKDLISGCKKYGAQMGWTGIVLENTKNFRKVQISRQSICEKNRENVLLLLLLLDCSSSVCNKLFDKKLFDEIEFPKGQKYEDMAVMYKIIDKTDKTFLSNECGYHYVQNEGSIIHSDFERSKMDYMRSAKEVREFIYDKYPTLSAPADSFYILVLSSLLSDVYIVRRKYEIEYEKILSELRGFGGKYLTNKYIPWFKKIMIFMDVHNMVWLVNIIKKWSGR